MDGSLTQDRAAGPGRPAPARRGSAPAILAAVLAVAALTLAARTLVLIAAMARPMPYWDAWEFMKALPAILDGRYGLADVVAFHNEHRIVTTRLLMLLDLRLFDGAGYLPTALVPAVLAAVGTLLGVAAAGGRRSAWVTAGVAVSLLLSVAQSDNYSSGFQIQFPLVDLFAVAATGFFALAGRGGAVRWPLVALAILADALAIGSMASGNAVLLPVLLVAVALRVPPRAVLAFSGTALALTAAWAVGFPGSGNPSTHDPAVVARYAVNYLGAALRAYPHAPLALGAALLTAYVAALVALGLRWRRRVPVDPVLAWLSAVASFVVVGAVMTAVGRAELGMETAVTSRYAVQSLLFTACLFLMGWRALSLRSASAAPRLGLAAATLALAAASTLAPQPLAEWRQRVDDYDAAGTAFAQGVFSDRAIGNVYPWPALVRPALDALAAHRLGPFSAREAAVYRPPTNAVLGDPAALPRCAASVDRVLDVGPGWREVDGWVVSPSAGDDGGGWVLAYDAAGKLIGFAVRGTERGDVARALARLPTRFGFRLSENPGRGGAPDEGGGTLVLVPAGGRTAACAVALPPPGP